MGVEIGLWNVDGAPVRMKATALPEEKRLEEILESDPSLFGKDLLIVGRQVQTAHGGYIDLLAVDAEGDLHVLELKRDRTPREVVAQLLDYGSWVDGLGYDDILNIFAAHDPGTPFESAFAEHFKVDSVPEELNRQHTLTIVAASLDSATERIVEYLNSNFGVPVNAMYFRYFEHDAHKYIARTWLLAESPDGPVKSKPSARQAKEPWNGHDWYASFGDEPGSRSWEDARRFGFISAGGGEWYSRTLATLPTGARVFVNVPKRGFVGVAEVTGESLPFEESSLEVDGEMRPMSELDLVGNYTHEPKPDQDTREYVVPVRFLVDIPLVDAFWTPGLFANQNSACRLRNQFTITTVARHFELADSTSPAP